MLLGFEPVKLLDLAGPLQVFSDAARENGAYAVTVASPDGGRIATDTSLPIDTMPLSALARRPVDTLLAIGGAGARAWAREPRKLPEVRRLARRARRVGSVCTGTFVLAEAGLLDGRRAVTHWDSCDALAHHYPGIQVEPDRIYVRDGAIWTSAGVTAGIDLALAMVADDLGRDVALRTARGLVTYMVRPGGQSQFSHRLAAQASDTTDRFAGLVAWIERNLADDLCVDRLAEHACMSPRTFARRFTEAMGVTPAKFVERVRCEAARALLEDATHPTKAVAARCGLDEERMRRAFERWLGVSPSGYRKRFGVAADRREAFPADAMAAQPMPGSRAVSA